MPSNTRRIQLPTRGPVAGVLGRSGMGIALAVLLFTALIWLRLRLVTDVPRQAYADPKPQEQRQAADPSDPARESLEDPR
ncbi:MAG: hypothetical protein RIB58_07460 [Phycisphaerales bacterium]